MPFSPSVCKPDIRLVTTCSTMCRSKWERGREWEGEMPCVNWIGIQLAAKRHRIHFFLTRCCIWTSFSSTHMRASDASHVRKRENNIDASTCWTLVMSVLIFPDTVTGEISSMSLGADFTNFWLSRRDGRFELPAFWTSMISWIRAASTCNLASSSASVMASALRRPSRGSDDSAKMTRLFTLPSPRSYFICNMCAIAVSFGIVCSVPFIHACTCAQSTHNHQKWMQWCTLGPVTSRAPCLEHAAIFCDGHADAVCGINARAGPYDLDGHAEAEARAAQVVSTTIELRISAIIAWVLLQGRFRIRVLPNVPMSFFLSSFSHYCLWKCDTQWKHENTGV